MSGVKKQKTDVRDQRTDENRKVGRATVPVLGNQMWLPIGVGTDFGELHSA